MNAEDFILICVHRRSSAVPPIFISPRLPPRLQSAANMNDVMPIIETRGLTRRFRSGEKTITVLSDVTLAVRRGEFAAIMGKSGSGKSTLLALLAGLDRPSEGGVTI